MATYLILNGLVLVITGISAYRFRRLYVKNVLLMSLGVIVSLTLLFDNLIILADIVDYDTSLITGAKLFVAPLEDFAYAIVAVLLMPILWKLTSRD